MSRRRGRRRYLPSGFPGSCRLFTILEDPATYSASYGDARPALVSLQRPNTDEHGRARLRVATDNTPIRSRGFFRYRRDLHVESSLPRSCYRGVNFVGDLRKRFSLFTSSVARYRATRFHRIRARFRKQLQFAIVILSDRDLPSPR